MPNVNCLTDADCPDTCDRAKCDTGNGECYIPDDAEPCIPGMISNQWGNSLISKTRGTQQGTTDYGPRGQSQEFSNFIPAPTCFGNCPNPSQIYYTQGTPGAPCPPSHPNQQMPNCAPPQPSTPGITTTFTNNMSNGLNQFGCSFLYNRHSVLQNKLNGLQSAGTNPLWQQMLQNRLSFINNLINNNCISGPMPPPPPGKTGGTIPVGPMSNASGDNRRIGITPQTHMIAGGGCDTCGVCHPNRCFECDAGGYKCDKGSSHFVPKSKYSNAGGMDTQEDDRAVRVAQIIGTWMN